MQGEIAGIREASAQNKQQTRVSAHVLGSRIDDVEHGGGGSGANVIIESLNETYIETTNTSTDSGKVLKVGAKTAAINGTESGLATAEDVRDRIAAIARTDVSAQTNTTDYMFVTAKTQSGGIRMITVSAITADISSTDKGLATAEDVRNKINAIAGTYIPPVVNYNFNIATAPSVTLTPNKVESMVTTKGFISVTLTIPSATVNETKDDIYVFRGYMRGQTSVSGLKSKVTVVSDASTQPTIVWKDNNVPDAIINVGYIEVRIKIFSKTLYLGEWSYYPESAVINE